MKFLCLMQSNFNWRRNFVKTHWQIKRDYRSSHSQMLFKISVLKYFANFTEKHLCWSLFFNKVAVPGLQFYQKDTPTQVFSREISNDTYGIKLSRRDPFTWENNKIKFNIYTQCKETWKFRKDGRNF